MSYEYTDSNGDSLWVKSVTKGEVLVRVKHYTGNGAGIGIPNADAPAIALAILEAAGITPSIGTHPDTTPEEFESAAAFYLREAINKRSKQAEREAEDAKVDDYRRVKVGPYADWTPWEHLTDSQRKLWRDDYQVSREFFAKEDTPAPRVLQYGDPEPDHGTKWRGVNGWTWSWRGNGWDRMEDSIPVEWPAVARENFPMTEVTGDAAR